MTEGGGWGGDGVWGGGSRTEARADIIIINKSLRQPGSSAEKIHIELEGGGGMGWREETRKGSRED